MFIFSCHWPSVCLLWKNIYLDLLPIIWLGCSFFVLFCFDFDIELHELVYLEINPLSVALLANRRAKQNESHTDHLHHYPRQHTLRCLGRGWALRLGQGLGAETQAPEVSSGETRVGCVETA